MRFDQGHALIVATGSHRHHPKLDVPITVTEGKAIGQLLIDSQYCGYPVEQVTLLTKSAATKENVTRALEELADSLPAEATVFLYFVGHGMTGTDGYWHFMTHDSRLSGRQVTAGTGLSEVDLAQLLRRFSTKRLITFFNACFSGNLSPTLAPSTDEPALETYAATLAPPPNLKYALLGTGSGRIVITAAGEGEYSYFVKGNRLTIFGEALIAGLKGSGVLNNGGFISAFGLYEALFDAVKGRVETLFRQSQLPELSVLKGVGPFAVSLYRGASVLGEFAPETGPPAGVQPVAPETAARIVNNYIGEGATQNINSTIVNAGDISGDLVLGNVMSGNTQTAGRDVNNIHIEGGTYIAGPVELHSDGSDAPARPSPRVALATLTEKIGKATFDADIQDAILADLGLVQLQLTKREPNLRLIRSKLTGVAGLLRDEGQNALSEEIDSLKNAF